MRIKFIKEILSKKRSIKEVAEILSVSRQSVSKWISKYRIEGEVGLIPKKCGPKNGIPINRTDIRIEETIGSIARMFPEIGPVGITLKLIEQTGIRLNQSTIYRILRRTHVRYKQKGEWRKRRKTLYVLDTPGREVQVDVCFPFGRKRRAVQYDAIDDCSRFVYSKLHTEHCVRSSMEFIDNLIQESPFPITKIRTDCGMEFGPGFTKFLEYKGIEHVRTAPYSPQHNGKVERYHRTLWQHMGNYSAQIDVHEYRLQLKFFTDWYNFGKPHFGLGMFGMTPAEKIGYVAIEKVLQIQRESEEPGGPQKTLNVNLTVQFNIAKKIVINLFVYAFLNYF